MAQVEPVVYHELEGPTPVPEGWENRPKQIKVNTITTEMTFCHTSTHMLAFMYTSVTTNVHLYILNTRPIALMFEYVCHCMPCPQTPDIPVYSVVDKSKKKRNRSTESSTTTTTTITEAASIDVSKCVDS